MNIFRKPNEFLSDYLIRIGKHYGTLVEACDYYMCETYNQFSELENHDYHLYWEDLRGSDTMYVYETAIALIEYVTRYHIRTLQKRFPLDYELLITDYDNMNTEINKVIIHD